MCIGREAAEGDCDPVLVSAAELVAQEVAGVLPRGTSWEELARLEVAGFEMGVDLGL